MCRAARDRSADRSRRGGNSARCTDSSRSAPADSATALPSRTSRIGASRRASPSVMTNIAVCADRRSLRSSGECVQPVLGDVRVKRAEIDSDERVDRLEDRAVIVRVVRAAGSSARASRIARGCIDRLLPSASVQRRRVTGSKVVQVRRQIAQRVANLAVRLRDAREDLLADARLLLVIAHRHPQTQDVGAALLDDILRCDHVAKRLRHLLAFGVEQEAVRQHLAIRRASPSAQPQEQRALEPATVLVAAFEVQVRTAMSVRAVRGSTASWLDPESNQTSRMFISFSNVVPPHAGHVNPGGRNSSIGPLVPGVSAMLLENGRGFFDQLRRRDRLAALRAIDGRNRHAPRALARNAPIRAAR